MSVFKPRTGPTESQLLARAVALDYSAMGWDAEGEERMMIRDIAEREDVDFDDLCAAIWSITMEAQQR